MSLLKRLVTRLRLRKAERILAEDPSVRNYVSLAREYVVGGRPDEVLRVCTEGLEVHIGNVELTRLAERARHLRTEERLRVLSRQLAQAPRPALWRESCELNLENGRLDRARAAAEAWFESEEDCEALLYLSRVHLASFLNDRRAVDGREAHALAARCQQQMPGDARPIEVMAEVAVRAGAWQVARRSLARLLEMNPGNPEMEARFRRVLTMCEGARDLEAALTHTERTGRFAEDELESSKTAAAVAVRPMLQELSADSDVRAAVYLRGGTALVQGPRGATADRTARAVREMVQAARQNSRRMRLGQPLEVLLEGDFGSLLLSPGEQSSSAVWCVGSVKPHHEELLKDLSGMAGLSTV